MINKEEFEKASFEEKQKFIKEILRLATHNAFTKDDLLFLLKWQSELIEKTMCCANCKHFNKVRCCRNDDKCIWELAE